MRRVHAGHAGRLRPHLGRARARPSSGCCRSGTPTGCRAPPPAAPRCWSAAGAGPWSAGSRWTWRSSTSARTAARAGDLVTVFGPGHDGEPTTAEWAAWAGTIEHEIVTGLGTTGPVTRIRVAVIGGGRNSEHEVSLASAAAVAGALDEEAYDVVRLTIDRDGVWRDREQRPIGLAGAVHVLRSCAVAIPVLHGPRGEDGTLAALCDLAGVPYVGSGVGAGALAMDKWATKLVARGLGVAVAAGRAADSGHRTGVRLRPPGGRQAGRPPAPATASRWSGTPTPCRLPSPRRSRSTTGCWSRTSWPAARSTSRCSAARTARRLVAPALEVVVDGIFDTGDEVRRHRRLPRPRAARRRRAQGARGTPRWWSTTASAARASPGSTSSSPTRARCSTR